MANNKYVWTNANVSEVLPGINPPLVNDFVIDYFLPTVIKLLEKATKYKIPKDTALIKVIKGRLYFNATILEEALIRLTGTDDVNIHDILGGQQESQKEILKNISFFKKAKLFLILGFSFLKTLFKYISYKRRLKKLFNKIELFDDEISKTNNLKELINLKQNILSDFTEWLFKTFTVVIVPFASYIIFISLCKKWLKDNSYSKSNILLSSGGEGIVTVDAFLKLWDISELFKKDREFREKFMSSYNTNEALKVLIKDKEILEKYDSFINEYGHRCAKELNFSVPRWSEDPSFIIHVLKNYIRTPKESNPHLRIIKLKNQQAKFLEEISEILPKWKFFVFKKMLKKAQSSLKLRENYKSQSIRYIVPLRTALLKIGSILSQKGLINDTQDIFMLKLEEAERLKFEDFNFSEIIEKRKKEMEENEKIILLSVIKDLDNINLDSNISSGICPILKGVAASYGKVEGVARVLKGIEEINKLKPGDILVTDHTDPGWTPIFCTIKGVVTNRGGLLSHASIVAREYGVPAVVNVEHATEIIQDGDYIILDGNQGSVKISLQEKVIEK